MSLQQRGNKNRSSTSSSSSGRGSMITKFNSVNSYFGFAIAAVVTSILYQQYQIQNESVQSSSYYNNTWFLIDHATLQVTYQSTNPNDICNNLTTMNNTNTTTTPLECLQLAKDVVVGESGSDLYCATLTTKKNRDDASSNDVVVMQGLDRQPTAAAVLASFDWKLPSLVGLAYLSVQIFDNRKTRHQKTSKKFDPFVSYILYLAVVVTWRSWLPTTTALLGPESLLQTAYRSYEIFLLVHPLSSTAIGICHLLTYWFEIAAIIKSRNLREFLFWGSCFEILTSLINETAHHYEDPAIRCLRASFVDDTHHYVLNDIVREYLMSPFLVYGIWFPKFLMYNIQNLR